MQRQYKYKQSIVHTSTPNKKPTYYHNFEEQTQTWTVR
jgi:hypothetical protein